MFTGIIQEVGRIDTVAKKGALAKIGVKSEQIWPQAQVSHSIAVNGVCLTLIYKEKGILFFEAIESTLALSNLKRAKKGMRVNLEPALKVGESLGGHFVLGHVDGEVRLRRKVSFKDYWRMEVEIPSSLGKWIVANGSVALEGISLTVKKILPGYFTAEVIPYTYKHTNLADKKSGDWLNIECDYLLKGDKK